MRIQIELKKLQSQGIFVDSKADKSTIVIRKSYSMVNANNGGKDYTFSATIAKNEVDRDGEVVLVEGIDTTEYQKNPFLCWGHNYSQFPLGKCVELTKSNGQLDGKFWTAETNTGKEAAELVKSGCLTGVSIGFIRKSIVKRGTQAFDNVVRKYNITLTSELKQITVECELVEVSLVDVQSNRSGLIKEIVEKEYKSMATAVGCSMDEENDSDITPMEDEIGMKPYPTQHSSRQSEPENFHKFRRVNNFAHGIDVIYGIHNGTAHIQSFRFDATKYTKEEAQAWLKKHNYKEDVVAAQPHKLEEEVNNTSEVSNVNSTISNADVMPESEPPPNPSVDQEGKIVIKEVPIIVVAPKEESKTEKVIDKVIEEKSIDVVTPTVKEPYVRIQQEINGITIYLVNGFWIRNSIDQDFCEGGNSFRYQYIPKNEVWIEADTSTEELPAIITHELTESKYMAAGEDYDSAHDKANEMEKMVRQEKIRAEDAIKQAFEPIAPIKSYCTVIRKCYQITEKDIKDIKEGKLVFKK